MKPWQNGLVIALGVLIAAHTSAGIHYDSFWTLLAVVLLISFFNLVLKPLLVLFALPFIILTLGFGLLLVNASLIKLTGWLVPGFVVVSWWSAFWAAAVISFTSMLGNLFLGNRGSVRVNVQTQRRGRAAHNPNPRRESLRDEDVIDI